MGVAHDARGRFTKRDPEVSFWEKVDKDTTPDGCWEWTASKSKSGYGYFRFRGEHWRAHRVAWVLTNGEIPHHDDPKEKLFVCHHCDNPACCRPDHLFLGKPRENTEDMCAKGRCGGIKNRGERNHNSVLSEWQALKIIKHPEIRLVDLGKEFGVSIQTISSVRSGRSWGYLRSEQGVCADAVD